MGAGPRASVLEWGGPPPLSSAPGFSHPSQSARGLTLDAAYLDIRAAREPGQAYVAVSRVRTLAGLHFKDWFKGLHVSPEAIRFYRDMNHG